jgi:hypothetical protein
LTDVCCHVNYGASQLLHCASGPTSRQGASPDMHGQKAHHILDDNDECERPQDEGQGANHIFLGGRAAENGWPKIQRGRACTDSRNLRRVFIHREHGGNLADRWLATCVLAQ